MSVSKGHSSAETGKSLDSRHPAAATPRSRTTSPNKESEMEDTFAEGRPLNHDNLRFQQLEARRKEDERLELQERIREHHAQLASVEREIAEAHECTKRLQRQLDNREIDSAIFDEGNKKIAEQLRDMDHDRSILRKKIDDMTPGSKAQPLEIDTLEDTVTFGNTPDLTRVKTEGVLTMTQDQLDDHVKGSIAEALARNNALTITQMRIKLGEAYIEQSKISDRMTLLTSKRSTRRSGQQDESEIVRCEEELQKNAEYITELERLMPTARPDDKIPGAPSPLMKLNNIPSSAHVSRCPSPEKKPVAHQPLTSIQEPLLMTPDTTTQGPEIMSTPLTTQPASTAVIAAISQTQPPSHAASTFNGPAANKRQVGMVLDRVREEGPASSHRQSASNPWVDAQQQRRMHNTMSTDVQEPNVNTQPASEQPSTPRTKPTPSVTSEGSRTRQSISHYAKTIAPMTFTGKAAQNVERFLKQMDRYLRRTEIDNEEEMTEQLHRYLSDEIRTALMNALTEDTEYDYFAQTQFLRCWWARSRDPRPLRDDFDKITHTPSEDIDNYASRIQRGRRAGWPHESTIRHGNFHSDYEKAVMDAFLKGLPKNLRNIIKASGKLDDIELHQSDFKELVEFTRIQIRNLTKKERLHCNECGKSCGHETQDCPRRNKVNALADDTASAITPDPDEQDTIDYSALLDQACAMIAPQMPQTHPYPQQQAPFRPPKPNAFQARNPAPNQVRNPVPRQPNQTRFNNPSGQRFEGCYGCGEVGHLIANCPKPPTSKAQNIPTDLPGIIKALDAVRAALLLKLPTATGRHAVKLANEIKTLEQVIDNTCTKLTVDEAEEAPAAGGASASKNP